MRDYKIMNRHLYFFTKIISLAAAVILAASVLTGCRTTSVKGPDADDAGKYVEALLDLTCTGSYSGPVSLSNAGRDKELEIRDSIIDDLYASTVEDAGLTEDVQALFRDFLVKAGQNCRYSVTDVTPSENQASPDYPEYNVTVSIEPLKAFKGASELLDKEMNGLENDTGKLLETDPEVICSTAFKNVFTALSAQLDQPEYESPQTLVVHYYPVDAEHNLYGISEEDCRRLGEKLFSMEGLNQD